MPPQYPSHVSNWSHPHGVAEADAAMAVKAMDAVMKLKDRMGVFCSNR